MVTVIMVKRTEKRNPSQKPERLVNFSLVGEVYYTVCVFRVVIFLSCGPS